MEINKRLEELTSRIKKVGSRPWHKNGGDFNDKIEYERLLDSFRDLCLDAFLGGKRFADKLEIVKHGKWLDCSNKQSASFGYTCSECLHTVYCCAVREPSDLPKYCSTCGAKMDLK